MILEVLFQIDELRSTRREVYHEKCRKEKEKKSI